MENVNRKEVLDALDLTREEVIKGLSKESPARRICESVIQIARIRVKMLQETDAWIPCVQRVPNDDGTYLATFKDDDGYFVDTCDYDVIQGWGYWTDDGGEYLCLNNVVAWKELPKPWNGGAKK